VVISSVPLSINLLDKSINIKGLGPKPNTQNHPYPIRYSQPDPPILHSFAAILSLLAEKARKNLALIEKRAMAAGYHPPSHYWHGVYMSSFLG
jgi:hypothetical protein